MSELGIPFVSLVIPCWNEEKRLARNLPDILKWAINVQLGCEVLVVDDHSTDTTREVVEKYLPKYTQTLWLLSSPEGEKGKGAAVKAGMLEGNGLYRIMVDVDLSTPLSEFQKLIDECQRLCSNNPINTPAIVIASRALPDSKLVRQPWYRVIAGEVMRSLTRSFVKLKYRDTQCGFKCFNKRATEIIFPLQQEQGFIFDVELLMLADKHNIPVSELGVIWENDTESKVNFMRDAYKMFKSLLALSKRRF